MSDPTPPLFAFGAAAVIAIVVAVFFALRPAAKGMPPPPGSAGTPAYRYSSPISASVADLAYAEKSPLEKLDLYSPAGSTVEVELRREEQNCCLRVTDQGAGVKPDEREQIFEKYGRGSAQPTGTEKSIGLGLWIVRRTVQELHGKLWCESGPGGLGAAFFVHLSLQPPEV